MARNVPNATNATIDWGTDAHFSILGDMTLCCWVNVGSNAPADGIIVGRGGPTESAADNFCYLIRSIVASGTWDVRYLHEASTGTNNEVTWNTNLTLGQWYFIAFTRNITTNIVTLYVGTPGTLLASFGTFNYTFGDPSGATTGNMMAFGQSSGTLYLDDSSIAELCIWDRILTLGELQAVMCGWLPPALNLKLYAPLEGVDSPEPDYSGNNKPGTVTSAIYGSHPPIGPNSDASLFELSVANPSTGAKSRRTISPLGTRTGSRQLVRWA